MFAESEATIDECKDCTQSLLTVDDLTDRLPSLRMDLRAEIYLRYGHLPQDCVDEVGLSCRGPDVAPLEVGVEDQRLLPLPVYKIGNRVLL
ncbi:MAG TPA: hypothetical protein VLL94_08905 [Nitrospiraceae bacterium]|nr:hypothetical protein [Nitrospiraceae bacterium]